MSDLEKAIFLDRDGTIIHDIGYLSEREDVRLMPYAARGIARFRSLGYLLIVVTNQSGIARGYISIEDFHRVNERMLELLGERGAHVHATYFCPHFPSGSVAPYNVDCDCRKPKPGMLLKAADEWGIDLAGSYMIGDSERDIQAGASAGCRTILLGDGPRSILTSPNFHAANLLEASYIVETGQ